jgi:hypothetical protein
MGPNVAEDGARAWTGMGFATPSVWVAVLGGGTPEPELSFCRHTERLRTSPNLAKNLVQVVIDY